MVTSYPNQVPKYRCTKLISAENWSERSSVSVCFILHKWRYLPNSAILTPCSINSILTSYPCNKYQYSYLVVKEGGIHSIQGFTHHNVTLDGFLKVHQGPLKCHRTMVRQKATDCMVCMDIYCLCPFSFLLQKSLYQRPHLNTLKFITYKSFALFDVSYQGKNESKSDWKCHLILQMTLLLKQVLVLGKG